MGIKMEFNKFDFVLVTPAYTPNAKHEGTIIATRKNKYVGMRYKVRYDCYGLIFESWFNPSELKKG